MQRNWIGRSTGADVHFVGRGSRRSRSPSTRPGRTRCSARRSSSSRPTPTWPPSWPPGLAAEADFAAYREQVARATEIERLATDRPKTGVFLHRYADQPGQRRSGSRSRPPTTSWPTTATARSWPCRHRTSGTGTSPRRIDLPVVRTVAPPAGLGRRGVSPATARRSTRPTTRSASTGSASTEAKARIIDWLDGKGLGRGDDRPTGCVTGCCPGSGSGAARSRSCTARSTARCRSPTTSCRCCCRTCAART